jgi:hypothetical protein
MLYENYIMITSSAAKQHLSYSRDGNYNGFSMLKNYEGKDSVGDPGSGAFLTPGSGIRIPDLIA